MKDILISYNRVDYILLIKIRNWYEKNAFWLLEWMEFDCSQKMTEREYKYEISKGLITCVRREDDALLKKAFTFFQCSCSEPHENSEFV